MKEKDTWQADVRREEKSDKEEYKKGKELLEKENNKIRTRKRNKTFKILPNEELMTLE